MLCNTVAMRRIKAQPSPEIVYEAALAQLSNESSLTKSLWWNQAISNGDPSLSCIVGVLPYVDNFRSAYLGGIQQHWTCSRYVFDLI